MTQESKWVSSKTTIPKGEIEDNWKKFVSMQETLIEETQKMFLKVVHEAVYQYLRRPPTREDWENFRMDHSPDHQTLIHNNGDEIIIGTVTSLMVGNSYQVTFNPDPKLLEDMKNREKLEEFMASLREKDGVVNVELSENTVNVYVHDKGTKIDMPLLESEGITVKVIPPMHG
jgi:molybdopterin converting factor small subunit